MSDIDRYLPIDEEGYFVFDGRRVDDEDLGQELIKNLELVESDRVITSTQGQKAWVEAFDAPLIARHVELAGPEEGRIDLPYHLSARFPLSALSTDEWDRFHGTTTERKIPFVFSRQAQVEFFDLLDSFDDDSVTIRGKRYAVPAWLEPKPETGDDAFWTQIYRTEKPGWEMGRESVTLPDVLPQLKLSKSRVLILGCGSGHDAAYFARQGHTVTAVDFSEEAIARAKANYGDVEGLTFLRQDAFALPESWNGRFDLIFEHTFYCAISPSRRNDILKTWKRMLHSQGHLLGVFFVMEKRVGPPFGGSEWELRERLKKDFQFLYWTRWRHSLPGRKSKELLLYARRQS